MLLTSLCFGLFIPLKTFAIGQLSHNPVLKQIEVSEMDLSQLKNYEDSNAKLGLIETSRSLPEDLKNSLNNFFRNPFVSFRNSDHVDAKLSLRSKNSQKGRLMVGEIPICKYEIGAHQSIDKERIYVGKVPFISPNSSPVAIEDWPHLEDALTQISIFMDEKLSDYNSKVLKYSKCYYVQDAQIIPVFNIQLMVNELTYDMYIGDNQIFESNSLHFHATRNAVAIAFEGNPNSSESEQDIVVDSSGYMQNTQFTTITNTVGRLMSTVENINGTDKHVFRSESGNTSQKGEVNSFTNAGKIYQYYSSLGYVNPDGIIDINLNVEINNSLNNALYQPAISTQTGQPRISISNGDGIILQNLSLDSDVISHEFGHHTIWRSLKNTTGESLVLHEGLADFFTFSYQGDSCLGESICPETSNFCWYKSQCLRSADNTISYLDANYQSLDPHLRGQLVSGFLWDLHDKENMSLADVSQLAYNAVDLLSSSSGVIDLVLSLNISDRDMNGGSNLCAIKSVAEARGLDAHINMDSCERSSSWSAVAQSTATVSSGSAAPAPSVESSKKKKDKPFGFCALSHNSDTNGSPTMLVIIFMIAIIPKLSSVSFRQNN